MFLPSELASSTYQHWHTTGRITAWHCNIDIFGADDIDGLYRLAGLPRMPSYEVVVASRAPL